MTREPVSHCSRTVTLSLVQHCHFVTVHPAYVNSCVACRPFPYWCARSCFVVRPPSSSTRSSDAMSTPRRKSSLGTSRRVPAKYIPYHADDYQRGKRTGLVVGYIEHNSDEFEPFEQVMNQADQRTPPRVQGVRKKRITKTPVVQQPEETTDDENGEMSMELEESEWLQVFITIVLF